MTRPFTDEDLATLKRLRAEGVTKREIAAILGRSTTTIENKIKRYEMPLPPKPPLAIPADFLAQWKTKSILNLSLHYNMSEHAVKMIVKRMGLKRPKIGANLTTPQARKDVAMSVNPNRYMTAARMPSSKAELTAAGRAADYLGGFYVPVHRCNDAGMFSPGASLWRCGTRIFDDREIVVRAEEVRGRRERMSGKAA